MPGIDPDEIPETKFAARSGKYPGWSIGQLAERAGLRASAIRYYESAGLLTEPLRHNGRRVYDESALEWLSVVRLAQRAGFSIAEIRTLLHGFKGNATAAQRWRKLGTRKLGEVRGRIEEARAMERVLERLLLDCECRTLRECARAQEGASDRA